MSDTYYLLYHNLLGKKTSEGCFLYQNNCWKPDEKNLIEDHLHGYDPSESPDSPYAFGNASIMREISEINREEAERYMASQDGRE